MNDMRAYEILILSLMSEGATLTQPWGRRTDWVVDLPHSPRMEDEDGEVGIAAATAHRLLEEGWVEEGPSGLSHGPTYWLSDAGRKEIGRDSPTVGLWHRVSRAQHRGRGLIGRTPTLPPWSVDVRSTPSGGVLNEYLRWAGLRSDAMVQPVYDPDAVPTLIRQMAEWDRDIVEDLARRMELSPAYGCSDVVTERYPEDEDRPERAAWSYLVTPDEVVHAAVGASVAEAQARVFVIGARWQRERDAMERNARIREKYDPTPQLYRSVDGPQAHPMPSVSARGDLGDVVGDVPFIREVGTVLELLTEHPGRTGRGHFSEALCGAFAGRHAPELAEEMTRIREGSVISEGSGASLATIRAFLEEGDLIRAAGSRFERTQLGEGCALNPGLRALQLATWVLRGQESYGFYQIPKAYRERTLGVLLADGELSVEEMDGWPDLVRTAESFGDRYRTGPADLEGAITVELYALARYGLVTDPEDGRVEATELLRETMTLHGFASPQDHPLGS